MSVYLDFPLDYFEEDEDQYYDDVLFPNPPDWEAFDEDGILGEPNIDSEI